MINSFWWVLLLGHYWTLHFNTISMCAIQEPSSSKGKLFSLFVLPCEMWTGLPWHVWLAMLLYIQYNVHLANSQWGTIKVCILISRSHSIHIEDSATSFCPRFLNAWVKKLHPTQQTSHTCTHQIPSPWLTLATTDRKIYMSTDLGDNITTM